jgi:hypothetical protein
MSKKDFSTSFLVDQTPMQAFDAIINVRAWWSETIEGDTENVGDEFIYEVKNIHYCKMKLIEAIPGKKVSWLITYNYFSFVKDKSEWTGTTINFDIAQEDGKTLVTFTHQGLTQEFECFDICSNAWGDYIIGSLRKLIATGQGTPNKKEGE